MCLHTDCMRNILFYGSPCVSSNCLFSCLLFHNSNNTFYISMLNSLMVFQIMDNLNLLLTQTAFTYHLWPMISIVSINIIDTRTLFLTITTFMAHGLHCVFPNHACFEIISHTHCIHLSSAHGLQYGLPNHWYYENASQAVYTHCICFPGPQYSLWS